MPGPFPGMDPWLASPLTVALAPSVGAVGVPDASPASRRPEWRSA